jgi:hypothetical protein
VLCRYVPGNCDDVIGEVYGEGRAGVDVGVFHQWWGLPVYKLKPVDPYSLESAWDFYPCT